MTSSGTSGGSPQKQLKKRLTSLARKTHNRVCCDCPEKAPTWAVILSPPSDYAPMGSRDLVAFVCFNCAAVHRQLGTSQVKSIALDECKYIVVVDDVVVLFCCSISCYA